MARRILLVIFLLMMLPVGQASASRADSDMFMKLGWVEKGLELKNYLENLDAVTSVYVENRHKLIWLDSELAVYFEKHLQSVAATQWSQFFSHRLLQLRNLRTNRQLFKYDLLATDTLISYVSYTQLALEYGGRWYTGEGISNSLAHLTPENLDRLTNAVKLSRLDNYIRDLHPSPIEFENYLSKQQTLFEALDTDVKFIMERSVIRVGDKLSNRDILIAKLKQAGIEVSELEVGSSHYDHTLKTKVMEFQRLHGLTSDGVIGSKSLYWLNFPIEEKIRLLAINAERSRLWSTQKDSLIEVNLPSFTLNYWKNGNIVLDSKVIVGRVSRKTPLMSTKMDSIVLNPTWNVPPKIMREDLIPQQKSNPDYLLSKGIDVIAGWTKITPIAVESIDWSSVKAKTFPYRMRQKSGDKNALGRYKFNTPNRRAIYLHDTPSKSLFNKDVRAFSSGCVRVEKASELANILMVRESGQQSIQPDALGVNEKLTLKRRIPVELIYKTAWVEGGKIHFRTDIYGYDAKSTNNSYAQNTLLR